MNIGAPILNRRPMSMSLFYLSLFQLNSFNVTHDSDLIVMTDAVMTVEIEEIKDGAVMIIFMDRQLELEF